MYLQGTGYFIQGPCDAFEGVAAEVVLFPYLCLFLRTVAPLPLNLSPLFSVCDGW